MAAETVVAKARWGFMSTAAIASKNFVAIKESTNAEVVAVASRSLEKARAWADERGVPKAYGSYDELLADADVDIVYIPLPTTLRKDWVIKAAEAGKHILCEKPCACTTADLAEMVRACAKAGVQFMDGVMFMHHDRLPLMAKVIKEDGTLGTVKRVTTGFSFPANEEFLASNIRGSAALEPLGALGDLGWYNTRFSLYAYDYELPKSVIATKWDIYADVPTFVDATLYWEDGRVASMDTAYGLSFRQWAEICGTSGHIEINDFCIARSPDETDFTVVTKGGLSMPDFRRVLGERVTTTVRGVAQETNMVAKLSSIALAFKERGADALEPFWPEVALKTQLVLDAVVASGQAGGARVDVTPLPSLKE